MISRELVKETLDASTNRYKKLGNIWMTRADGGFGYDNLAYDSAVEPREFCERAEELFELYKRCSRTSSRR